VGSTTLPDWEQARVFLAIARERSLGAASKRLELDVSTMSRRLDRLEEHLGAPLFDRTRAGTTLTALGEQVLPAAEEMELAALRFAAAGAQVETEVEGTVRLTLPPGIADVFVAPELVRLYERHPRLVLELDASVRYADLTRHEADLALRATRPTSGDLVAMQLISARPVPLTSPGYARELGTLKRLEGARWITWGAELSHLADAKWLREHAPRLAPVLRTNHFGSQLAAARSGLGIVIAAQPFSSPALVPVALGKSLSAAWSRLPSGTLWLVGHRALRRVPRIAAVWSFLAELFERTQSNGLVDSARASRARSPR
jgi:DNA-binding transcriptional LysR family regulator